MPKINFWELIKNVVINAWQFFWSFLSLIISMLWSELKLHPIRALVLIIFLLVLFWLNKTFKNK